MNSNMKCRRCGGTGTYSKGMVVNGVCFGCGGSGIRRLQPRAERSKGRITQYVIVDIDGRHLAMNPDRNFLEQLLPTLTGAVGIIER